MATLVAYGMPQKNIALRSATGAPLHKTLHFDSKNFTEKVRDDFEKALRVALQRFIASEVPDVSQAKFLFTPDIKTLSMALATRRYDRVIYYGHALADGVTLAPLQRITAPQIAHALKGSGVKHVDILGCDSSSIGALLATLVPGLAVGTLRGKRFDDFKVDPSTMKIQDFTIVPMQIFHFGGK